MKWSEVRNMYPDQFVKLKVLSSHYENYREIIVDIYKTCAGRINNKKLLKSKGED